MNEGWFITRGIQQREKEQEERQQLNNIIKKSESEIDKLLDKKSEYQLEVKNFEVEEDLSNILFITNIWR